MVKALTIIKPYPYIFCLYLSLKTLQVGVQDPFQRSQKSPKKFNKLGVSTEVDEINSNDTQSVCVLTLLFTLYHYL